MSKHIVYFFLLLFTMPQAETHYVSYNQSYSLTLKDGDIVQLQNFPEGWDYNTVESRIDGVVNSVNRSTIECSDEKSILSGWSTTVQFSKECSGNKQWIYHGSQQDVKFIWWVTSDSSNKSKIGSDDSISFLTKYNISATQLTSPNIEKSFSTNSSNYFIDHLPLDQKFNVVAIAVEPRDSKELDGDIYIGNNKLELKGWYSKYYVDVHSFWKILFKINFHEKRDYIIRWWVENKVPAQKDVSNTKVMNDNGNLSVSYHFTEDHAVEKDLLLEFNPNDLQDGTAPVIKRLEHLPLNVQMPKSIVENYAYGPVYDISGSLIDGKEIALAIPIPEEGITETIPNDSIMIVHYDSKINQFVDIKPDSIENGYVYFRTKSFSPFYVRWSRKVANTANAVVSTGGTVVRTVGSNLESGVNCLKESGVNCLKDALRDGYKNLVNGVCSTLDFKNYLKIYEYFKSNQSPMYNVYQAPSFKELNQSAGLKIDYLKKTLDSDNLEECSLTGVKAIDEHHCMEVSKRNAELLLADVIYSNATGIARRFNIKATGNSFGTGVTFGTGVNDIEDKKPSPSKTYSSTKIFLFNSTLLKSGYPTLKLLQECDAMLGVNDELSKTMGHIKDAFVDLADIASGDLSSTCRNVLSLPADAGDWLWPDALSCVSQGEKFLIYSYIHGLNNFLFGKFPLKSRDDHLIASSDFLNTITLLAWADDDYRSGFSGRLKSFRNQMHSYLGLVHDIYGNNNNIPIKAMAGVALYDQIFDGGSGTYNTLKEWLESKSDASGGYAEGTGYLEYINKDVPYILAALKRSNPKISMPENYLKNIEWLLNQSRKYQDVYGKNHWLPVEVGDGVIGYTPDFHIYSYLTGDGKYSKFANGSVEYFSPIQFVAWPSTSIVNAAALPVLPKMNFSGGVGILRFVDDNNESMTATIIAKNGGQYWDAMGHYQQDNGSVTLMHEKKGPLLVDPGYGGFGTKNMGYAFGSDHNSFQALAFPQGGSGVNAPMSNRNFLENLSKLPGVYNLDNYVNQPQGMLNTLFSTYAGYIIYGPIYGPISGLTSLTLGLAANTAISIWGDDPVDNAGYWPRGGEAQLLSQIDLESDFGFYGMEIKRDLDLVPHGHDLRAMFKFANRLWVLDRPDFVGPVGQNWNLKMKLDLTSPELTVYDLNHAIVTPVQQNLDKEQHTYTAYSPTSLSNAFYKYPFFSDVNLTHPNVLLMENLIDASDLYHFVKIPCGSDPGICLKRSDPSGKEEMLLIAPHGQSITDTRELLGQSIQIGGIAIAVRNKSTDPWRVKSVFQDALSPESMSKSLRVLSQYSQLLVDRSGISSQSSDGTIQRLFVSTGTPLPALRLLLK